MKVALYQARTGIHPGENAAALARAAAEAAAGGAMMLFTPEMSGLLDRDAARASAAIVAEDEDVVLRAACSAAVAQGLWIQLGSLAIRRPDGRLANRAFLIDPEGAIRTRYDKVHLFDVDLPSGESWRESARYAAGERAVVAETPLGVIGLSICYDLRFPALYAALVDDGAEVFAIPAAFTAPTGRAHWHVLCRARAIECGAFVVAAAQCGHHADGRDTFGHSLVVSPWGEVLLDMADAIDAVAFAEIDPSLVASARNAIPVQRHRRPVSRARAA